MVIKKSERLSFRFNSFMWDKIIALTMHTQKKRSAALELAVNYFYEIVKDISVPKDDKVESARKLVIFDSLSEYFETAYYRSMAPTHQIGCKWEKETVEKFYTTSRKLGIPIQATLTLAIYSYWESFNKNESESILSRLERIVAILKE